MKNDIIQKAITIVGQNEGDDTILNPEVHALLFSEAAPELARMLKSAELEGVADKYSEYDNQAISAQNKFKDYSERAMLWVFLTACCSALLLAVATLFGQLEQEALSRSLFVILSIAALVSGFLASTHIKLAENMKLFEKWMKNRANAEMQRLDYFERFTNRKPPENDSTDAVFNRLLQLEFFRRFQLDLQLSYYTQRGMQHGTIAEKAASITTWAMGAAGLAAGIAGFLGSALDPKWVAIAGFGFICQAYASNVLNKEAINQDRRNEERYGRTKDSLKNLRMQLDKVRTQIVAGNQDVLVKFVIAVHEQLSLEHRQWTDDISLSSKALVELQAQLKNLETGAAPKGDRQ